MVGNNRVVVGYYSYIGPDGKLYTTHYTADQNGYRATGSHFPVQDTGVQPLSIVSRDPGSGPGPNPSLGPVPLSNAPAPFISSSTPAPFFSSTPAPFVPTAFGSTSAYNDVPSSTPYRDPYRDPYRNPYRDPNHGFNTEFGPTTPTPYVSSTTPIGSTASPFSVSTRRPPFPVYRQGSQPPANFQGYNYPAPRINLPYSQVSEQTAAPFFPSSPYASAPSNINPRITPTLPPPTPFNDYNSVSSTTVPPFDDAPVRFRQYIPPAPIVASTPRPFDNFAPNQPNTVVITPKPAFQQQRLPNSLSINQNLLPPYLSVGPLNPGPQHIFRDNANFVNGPPFDFNNSPQPSPQTVSPLTITNLNFRKKRDDEKIDGN